MHAELHLHSPGIHDLRSKLFRGFGFRVSSFAFSRHATDQSARDRTASPTAAKLSLCRFQLLFCGCIERDEPACTGQVIVGGRPTMQEKTTLQYVVSRTATRLEGYAMQVRAFALVVVAFLDTAKGWKSGRALENGRQTRKLQEAILGCKHISILDVHPTSAHTRLICG